MTEFCFGFLNDVRQQKQLLHQLTEAKNNFQLALAYLRFLSSDETISDVENLENIAFEIPQNNLLYTQALENRDEIKIQDIQVNATKKNINIANSAYYPSQLIESSINSINSNLVLGFFIIYPFFIKSITK
jgi:outer membrane protein TolC